MPAASSSFPRTHRAQMEHPLRRLGLGSHQWRFLLPRGTHFPLVHGRRSQGLGRRQRVHDEDNAAAARRRHVQRAKQARGPNHPVHRSARLHHASPIAAAWLERLKAPKKVEVWFENSAHLPTLEEPGRVFAALLQHVHPLALAEKGQTIHH